ncbi:MAG: hypothetical protein MUC95_02330 [Spirochaetes bacterium]|nr:hypothetical protein [Spirochaetota bacterium]
MVCLLRGQIGIEHRTLCVVICSPDIAAGPLGKIIRMKSIPLGTLITHRIKLDDIQKGFQAVASPVEHNSIKVIVEPNRT